jgi:hypothetical protein
MASNSSRTEKSRRAGHRRNTRPTGIGLVQADDLARELFGAVGRAKFAKRFPAHLRYQIGVRTGTKGESFGVIGTGGSWEEALNDARLSLQRARMKQEADAAKAAAPAPAEAPVVAAPEAAAPVVTTEAPSADASV